MEENVQQDKEPLVPESMLKDVLFWALDNNDKPTGANNEPPKDNVLHYACRKGYLPVVKMLIEDRKMPYNAPGDNNSWPIQVAIESRNVEIVRYLKRNSTKGALLSPTYGNVFVQMILEQTDTSFAKFLLECKMLPNSTENGKKNLLHYIVQQCLDGGISNANLAKLVLENGLCPSFKDTQGKTSLDIAIELNNTPMVKMIFDYFGNHKAIGSGCACKNEQLIFKTKSSNYLLQAVRNKNTEIVDLLIKKGANVNIQDFQTKKAPIHEANDKIAELLIANGANIDIQDKMYETSLHIAAKNGNKELALILLRNGANTDLENKGGKTAQEIANENQHFDIAEMIIREKTVKKIQQKFDIVSKSNPFQSVDLGNSVEVLKDEKQAGRNECVICFGPKNGTFTFLPCGHAKTCEKCSKIVADSEKPAHEKLCPICRTPVTSFLKIIT